jgi:hypothetical protein
MGACILFLTGNMNFIFHYCSWGEIAEIESDDQLLNQPEDALGIIYSLDPSVSGVMIHEKNISPSFFDLKNRLAGEILQKFSNHRTRLVILGDFSKFASISLKSFIYESNKNKHVVFAENVAHALEILNRS